MQSEYDRECISYIYCLPSLCTRLPFRHIGSNTDGGLDIGQNVVYIKLPGIVTAVSGGEDFDIDISTDGETYTKTNIEVGYREKAITEESAVIIV